MNKKVIADDDVYSQSLEPSNIKKNLDIRKLRILLNNLGFRPVTLGTKYIIESVSYCFENNIFGNNRIEESYKHTAQKYHVRPDTVLWDIQKAVDIMNVYADRNLLHEIFYWCDKKERIPTKTFMDSFLNYLEENEDEYKK